MDNDNNKDEKLGWQGWLIVIVGLAIGLALAYLLDISIRQAKYLVLGTGFFVAYIVDVVRKRKR